LRSVLTEAAKSASRQKNTYLSAQYHRIAARRGVNRATVAVAHTMLGIIYHMLTKRQVYKELGADYFDRRQKESLVKRTIKRLELLGYQVTVADPVN
jgi:transposase